MTNEDIMTRLRSGVREKAKKKKLESQPLPIKKELEDYELLVASANKYRYLPRNVIGTSEKDEPRLYKLEKAKIEKIIRQYLVRQDFTFNKCSMNADAKTECANSCELGQACKNSPLYNNLFKKVIVKSSGATGNGLFADEDADVGELICDFTGDLFSKRQFKKLVRSWPPKKRSMTYFIEVLEKLILDPTDEGNVARYSNHSCEPNCRLLKREVNGELKVGLFAIKKIKKGQEITWSYGESYSGDILGRTKNIVRCKCGTPSCRQYITSEEVARKLRKKDEKKRLTRKRTSKSIDEPTEKKVKMNDHVGSLLNAPKSHSRRSESTAKENARPSPPAKTSRPYQRRTSAVQKDATAQRSVRCTSQRKRRVANDGEYNYSSRRQFSDEPSSNSDDYFSYLLNISVNYDEDSGYSSSDSSSPSHSLSLTPSPEEGKDESEGNSIRSSNDILQQMINSVLPESDLVMMAEEADNRADEVEQPTTLDQPGVADQKDAAEDDAASLLQDPLIFENDAEMMDEPAAPAEIADAADDDSVPANNASHASHELLECENYRAKLRSSKLMNGKHSEAVDCRNLAHQTALANSESLKNKLRQTGEKLKQHLHKPLLDYAGSRQHQKENRALASSYTEYKDLSSDTFSRLSCIDAVTSAIDDSVAESLIKDLKKIHNAMGRMLLQFNSIIQMNDDNAKGHSRDEKTKIADGLKRVNRDASVVRRTLNYLGS